MVKSLEAGGCDGLFDLWFDQDGRRFGRRDGDGFDGRRGLAGPGQRFQQGAGDREHGQEQESEHDLPVAALQAGKDLHLGVQDGDDADGAAAHDGQQRADHQHGLEEPVQFHHRKISVAFTYIKTAFLLTSLHAPLR